MTAGAGIVHSELPAPALRRNGGRSHGFQIWVNLPAAHKFAAPGYQYLPRDRIPIATSADGGIEVTVIAGEAFGVKAAIGTHTPIWLQDWRVRAGASAAMEIAPAFNAAAYVFDGEVAFGTDCTPAGRGQMALLGAGDRLAVGASSAGTGGRFLLLAGEPIGETVARHGPFVMNTQEELVVAIEDYRGGRMGVIERN